MLQYTSRTSVIIALCLPLIGYLEDFLLEEEYYNDLDANFTNIKTDLYPIKIVHGAKREKRQAGFPGADSKTDENRYSSRTHVHVCAQE